MNISFPILITKVG